MNAQRSPLTILQKYFGFKTFIGEQEKIIQQVLSGGNAFVLMPTGGGKSLCYQIPAILQNGITLVISPLIALMQDQVSSLHEIGISATYIASNLTTSEMLHILNSLQSNQIKLLYITPERLLSRQFINCILRLPIDLLAIDEAHCISHWGHDFRPEYRHLSRLDKILPNVPRLALTATADHYTRIDIMHYLNLKSAPVFTTSFLRQNFILQVVEKASAKQQLLQFVQQNQYQTGIIYCNSRARVDMITEFLIQHNIPCLKYHAGLDAAIRDTNQQEFMQSNNMVMVATIAFGMGIDKPDVRYVYHLDMPKSIDHFYQEAGRAGRDNMPAKSIINFGFKEILYTSQLIHNSEGDALNKKYSLNKLKQMLQYCETHLCRQQMLLSLLGENIATCGKCDNCTNPPLMCDMTVEVQKILATIYRVKQKFSTPHIVDILRGKSSISVQIWEHHKLSTFGLCNTLTAKTLRRIIRQLYCQGIIDIEHHNGNLKLNEKSLPILRGIQDIHLPQKIDISLNYSANLVWLRTEIEERLYQKLLLWRQQKAISHKVSNHAIVSDKTIYELIKHKPHDLVTLANIYGIGTVKLMKFGNEILNCLTPPLENITTPNFNLTSP